MNPLLIGGAAAAVVYALTRDKSDGSASGESSNNKPSNYKVPDPPNPLPTNTGTEMTADIISKLEKGEEPLEKNNDTSKDAVTYILEALGMRMPLSNIESREKLQGYLTSYTGELAKILPAFKGFDFAGDANTQCISTFMMWNGNISFLPKYTAHNPLNKPALLFESSSAHDWVGIVRRYFFCKTSSGADELEQQLFPDDNAKIPVQFKCSIGQGEITFARTGKPYPYNYVTAVDDANLRLARSFITYPADIYNQMNVFIKDTVYGTVDYILSLGLDSETMLSALFAWLVNWSETFGAFDLREATQTNEDPPTFNKVSVGGYDVLRYMQEKTNDDGDAFLFRQFSRYAAMFRHISFRAFCLANKETGKKMIACLTKEDIQFNPNLDAVLKELSWSGP